MKKIFGVLVLISFLGILIIPQMSLAAEDVTTGPKTSCKINEGVQTRIKQDAGITCDLTCFFTKSICAKCCLLSTIYNITDMIFFVLVAISGIMILLGAFNLLFAAGESEKINKGRNYIIYAAVGLAVGFLARAIPALVSNLGGF